MNGNEGYSEIGELLRQARKDMRLSVADAASRLHIRPHYLELLEAGQFKELPGVSYAKGYLARYAAFLRLDKDEVLRRFERVEDALGRRGFYLPLTFSKEKKPSRMFIWGGAAAALAIYLLWSQLMAPQHGQAPVVESLEEAQARKVMMSAEQAGRIACLAGQKQYYPACFWLPMDRDDAVFRLIDNEYRAALLLATLQSSMGQLLPAEGAASPAAAEKPPITEPKPAARRNKNAERSGEDEDDADRYTYPSDDRRR